MPVIKIIGVGFPNKFVNAFLKGLPHKSKESKERFYAEFKLEGSECRLLHDYAIGDVVIWMPHSAVLLVLKRITQLSNHLQNALFVGAIELEGEGRSDGYVTIAGKTLRFIQCGNIWLAEDNPLVFFSADFEGVMSIIESLEGDK